MFNTSASNYLLFLRGHSSKIYRQNLMSLNFEQKTPLTVGNSISKNNNNYNNHDKGQTGKISPKKTWTYLQKGNFKRETKSLIKAA